MTTTSASDRRPRRLLGFLIITLLSALLFGVLLERVMERQYDYYFHTDMARSIWETRSIGLPHPLLHLLVIAVHAVTRSSYWNAMFIVVLAALVINALIVFAFLEESYSRGWQGLFSVVFLTLSLVIVSAAAWLAPFDHHLYFGYLSPNTYHNPTVLLLKPLAFSLHLVTLHGLSLHHRRGLTQSSVLAVLLTLLCALAKPNYLLCLLPSVLLTSIFLLEGKRSFDRRFIAFGVLVPGVAILLIQYYVAYITARPQPGGVILAPLAVFSHWSGFLLPKFFLSIVFPAAVYIGHWKSARSSLRLNFSWLVFLIGAFYAYLLAESGERMTHGNFWWGAQVALFILFVESVRFCIEEDAGPARPIQPIRDMRHFLIWPIAFGMHLAAGIVWYGVHVLRKFYF